MRDELTPGSEDLDHLLDSALATYTSPEPSPNLGGRILSATTQRRRRESLSAWAIWTVPALAVLLTIVILIGRHEPVKRTASPINARLSFAPQTPQPAPNPRTINPAVTKVETTHAAVRTNLPRTPNTIPDSTPAPLPLPKQQVFPTPTPLSPQEQALAALVNRDSRDSKELAQQLTQPALQAQPTEPLRIAAIHIPPLNPPDNGNN